jgi:putative inorganic carbon (HCO3(-)) transporter
LALVGFLLAGVGVLVFGLLHPTFLDGLAFFRPLSDLIPSWLVQFPGDVDGFNANRISGTLLWVAPLTWVLAVMGLSGFRKMVPGWLSAVLAVILLALALLMSLTLMFLFSRAAQASFLAIMAILFGLLAGRQRWLIIVGLVSLIVVGWMLASSPELQVRVEQLVLTISGETTGGSTAVESFSGRIEIWERAYYTVRDFPITGIGMNKFPDVMLTYYPPITFRIINDITHPHNQLLIVGTDLGLPGMIAYIALMVGVGWMLWQCWRHASQPGEKMLALGFAASLLAFELFGLFDGIGLGEKPAVFFWFLLGLSGGLHNRIHQPTLSKSTILPK